MKTASDVEELVAKLIQQGKSKTEIIIAAAEACLGWPYVWGAVGAPCTPEKRKAYAMRDVCPAGEVTQIYKTCQYYTDKGEKSGKSCGGCQFYPNNMRVLINDCQGFVKKISQMVGITYTGGGASSMWNGSTNWEKKGTRDTLPEQLCCIFWQASDKKTMSHIGWYIGGGWMIHCSGTVKKEKLSAKVTHWAIPKGLNGNVPTTDKPTLRRGSSGEYVTLLQTKLIQRGYDLQPYGADGKYGAKTENAVKAFQRDNGLTADGVCGKNTWSAIDSGKTTLYTVTIQHVSKSVAENIVGQYGGVMKAEG